MADRKIDPNTAAVLEELSRRTKYEPYTEAFPATEPAPSASPLGPKPSHDGPKSFFSSILGDKSWFPRRPKYYSSFDSSLPADPSEWTDEQREQAEKRAKIWYVNAGPGTAGPSPLAAGTFGLTSGAILGFVGSTLQNAVQNHNHGWKGVFTRTGGTIWSCALAGAVYGSVDAGLRQYRNKADAWNKFSGGCAAGFLIGMQRKSLPLALGSCVFLGSPVAILEAQGGTLRGDATFEQTSLAGQRAQRYSGMFRKPPMTKAERRAAEEAAAALAEGEHLKPMSPVLREILEDREAAKS